MSANAGMEATGPLMPDQASVASERNRARGRRRVWAPVTALALVLAPAPWATGARADVLEIGAAADTTLYENDGSLANGAGEYVFAGDNAMDQERRALLRFDVAAALPAGATVTAVELVLQMSRGIADPNTIGLHRVTAPWSEGASDAAGEEGAGATAESGEATWSHRVYETDAWSTPGGDFDATALASLTVEAPGSYSFTSVELAADVQAALDTPAAAFGWLLRGSGGPAKRFDSHQNLTAVARPRLVVTFTPPLDPTGACCADDGSCALVLHDDAATACSAASYQGQGVSCAPNPCPQPTGACCLPDAAGSCEVIEEAACVAQSGAYHGADSLCAEQDCPAILEPFVDALPILPVASPTRGTEGGEADYTLSMKEIGHKLHRDLPETTVWGFDDGAQTSFPGPTIESFRDQPVSVTWENDLRELQSGTLRSEHYLPVDTCVHGAQDGPPRTVTHLHGGHVPARYDGFPEDAYPPGEAATYVYPNDQLAATLWYHDHSMGTTRLGMYMGLAGMYVVRDTESEDLGLPSGAYDIPLVIQDRSLRGDGSLIYPEAFQEHFFGNTMVVNGKAWPYLEVDRGKYRFRVLNACNGRTLRLSLDDGASFYVIGSDGGLLEEPVEVTSMTLGAAERAELVIDFEGYRPGTEIVLTNDAPAPFPGAPGVGVVANVVKFIVRDAGGYPNDLPESLVDVAPIDPATSDQTRDFVLGSEPTEDCGGRRWTMNGLRWFDVTEYPALGSTEIWRFVNPSGISHPMHMHLVQFQILDRQPIEVSDGVVVETGDAEPPPPEEAGWKDTVLVHPGQAARVIARFTDYTGTYVYHCHIAEHEDHEMMRQFVVTTTCGDGFAGDPDEACDDGNGSDADACPDGERGTCQPARCGDGLVWSEDGGEEECDDGEASADCDDDCTRVECGDGVVNEAAGERCDDGEPGGDPSRCAQGCDDAGVGGQDAGAPPDATDAGMQAGGSDGGCGCRVAGRDQRRAPWLLALPWALALLRRRRRRQPG